MADSSSGSADSRRNFLKIGAGVVVGAVVAGAGVAAYESSVIGSNNSSSSSVVGSLSDELSTTQAQLSDTQDSLASAQNTISTLSSQLGSTQTALGNAQSSLSAANSQNANLSSQLTATQQSLTTASGQVTSLQATVSSQNNAISTLQGQVATVNSQLTTANSEISSLQGAVSSASAQAGSLQIQIDTTTAFQTLSLDEQAVLAAIVTTFIPTDSNGPGAISAGVMYFIDGQLAGKYGWCGNMYMDGPFVPGNLTTPITIGGVTFSEGTMPVTPDCGQRYQYNITLRDYWRLGLSAVETYANKAYGGNFETLSAADQVKCLQDLYNNVPTQASFSDILPQDFFYELYFMTWCGFLTDPMYGGNKNMVGWDLVAFNGTNQGNFYGEGYTTQQLMLMTTPVALKPASLGQYQKGSP